MVMAARSAVLASLLVGAAWGTACPDDPDVDLCDTDPIGTTDPIDDPDPIDSGAVRPRTSVMPVLLLASALGGKRAWLLPLLGAPLAAEAGGAGGAASGTCGAVKHMYKQQDCCGNPDKELDYLFVPKPVKRVDQDDGHVYVSALFGENICKGAKPVHANATAQDGYFNNIACKDPLDDGVRQALEQSGANVTAGYQGEIDANATRRPILTSYLEAGLCPVNVHWHLGAEHYSLGQYDENGTGPNPNSTIEDDPYGEGDSRRLAAARLGFRCNKFDGNDAKFTTEYTWQHCVGMHVGETYEVHWPHSAAGACGTPHQYQTPFYDGVFCRGGIISLDPLNTFEKIGVQSQVYTIVNDESYYYPDLMRGMIVDGDFGLDVAKYTGSTTGTSRNNTVCSRYTPITWQVDRTCHLISASTFDKMCADMKMQHDDMTDDLHAHGARELVADEHAADNFHRM